MSKPIKFQLIILQKHMVHKICIALFLGTFFYGWKKYVKKDIYILMNGLADCVISQHCWEETFASGHGLACIQSHSSTRQYECSLS